MFRRRGEWYWVTVVILVTVMLVYPLKKSKAAFWEGPEGRSITTDSRGNIYITGWSNSIEGFGDNLLHPYSGGSDIFVVKLDPDGNCLWHTFYGSTNEDGGLGIALDKEGNIYVSGWSYASWDGPNGEKPLHPYSGGESNMFVLKLNASGNYVWHTFYPSQTCDAIAVDDEGNVYVTGMGHSWVGDGNAQPKHDSPDTDDGVFVLKLDTNGRYLWHTFYGKGACKGYAIAIDNHANVYVTGVSTDYWEGDGNTPPKHQGNGLFVLKLDKNGNYLWHTFYGIGGAGYGISVDDNSNVYVTGYSNLTWNGDGNTPPKHQAEDREIMVVLKLDTNGNYLWHTFYGGRGESSPANYGIGIALDGRGNLYVTGGSASNWNGDEDTPPKHSHSSLNVDNIVILKLDTDGNYLWHTFYCEKGGGRGIIANNGYVYITGRGTGCNNNECWYSVSEIVVLKVLSSGELVKGNPRLHVESPSHGVIKEPENGSHINCGSSQATTTSQCYNRYESGSKITLYAIPESGFVVDHWSGDCEGCSGTQCSITMDKDKTCGVVFGVPNLPPEITTFRPDPESGNAPLSVSFYCSAQDPNSYSGFGHYYYNDIARYEITFGDGGQDSRETNSNSAYFTHTYNSPGQYSATCKVIDKKGAYDTKSTTVQVKEPQSKSNNQPPVIDSFTASPTSGNAPLSVSFSCSAHDSDGEVVRYNIALGDGSSPETTTTGSATHTYSFAGTYTATCVAVDDKGAESASRSVTITVSSPSDNGGGNTGGEPVPSSPVVKQVSPADSWVSFGKDAEDGKLTGSEKMSLVIDSPEYQGKVDLYVAIAIPGALLFVDSANQIVAYSGGPLPPFRTNTSESVNLVFFEDFPLYNPLMGGCVLPEGDYWVYTLVVPAGTNLDNMDWKNGAYELDFYKVTLSCSQAPWQ